MTKGELYKRLNQVRDLDASLRIVGMKIERLEGCLQGHAIRYDRDKVQTSPSDPVAEVMGDLEILLKQQDRLRVAMTRAVADVAGLIGQLKDNKQMLVMHYRYVAGLTWPVIAARMQFSERHTFRLHDEAVDYLCKNF